MFAGTMIEGVAVDTLKLVRLEALLVVTVVVLLLFAAEVFEGTVVVFVVVTFVTVPLFATVTLLVVFDVFTTV